MSELCIECDQVVRPRQQGLQCKPCGGWFHRVCGTGVSQKTYREAVRNELSINWRCISCRSEDPDPQTEQITLDTLNNNSTIFLPVWLVHQFTLRLSQYPHHYLIMKVSYTHPPNNPYILREQ